MNPREAAIHEAIDAIDGFLRLTAQAPGNVSESSLRDLSHKIEKAQLIRTYTLVSNTAESHALNQKYRLHIERLHSRLAETERCLLADQARVAGEHDRFARVREWHDLFTTTQ